MEWIISHQSALEYWRKAPAKDALAGKKPRAIKPHALPLDIKELQAEKIRDFTLPLHVLVGSDNARKAHRNLRCHISSGEFPGGSFIQTDSGLVVSSPELCFLQLAALLPFTELVTLGFELCGSYRLDPKSAEGLGFRTDLPLTNIVRLSSYVVKAVGLKGRTKALKALRFIADGSASPMETILTVLLTFPYKLGGYGFSKPLLNYCVEVTIKIRKSTVKSKYYCDMYWPDKKVDVEYDSDAFHTGTDRIAKDAIRRNALASAGVTVVTVSRRQVVETPRLRELAKVLSKLLGKRLQYPTKKFIFHHAKLMNQLLSKIVTNKQSASPLTSDT